jgi:excisionase family DNA binding protein
MTIPDPETTPTLTVEQAAELLGLGRSSGYLAAQRGEIPTLKFGRALRVPTVKLRQMLGIDAEREPDSSTAEVVPIRQEAGR